MEKRRSRFSVTADAYGLTNSGVSRSLASRPSYRTDFEVTPIRPTIAIQRSPFGKPASADVTDAGFGKQDGLSRIQCMPSGVFLGKTNLVV